MNENDPIEPILAQFRKVDPPEAVRNSNRKAVQVALEQPIATHWWQHSIRVPLPVMLASAAVVLISLSTHFFPARDIGQATVPEFTVEPSREDENIETTLVAATDSHIDFSETQRYLSGVGVIDRNITYRLEE